MAETVIYTMEDYTALCKAIGQGALSTKYGDKEVTFRSLAEMLKIKKLMEINLGLRAPGRVTKYIQHSKGIS